MIKKALCILFILSNVYLVGCASTTALSSVDKESIKSVSVSKNVKYPSSMYLMAPGTALAIGAIPGVIAGSFEESASKKINAYAENNDVYVSKIVREQFVVQLKNSRKFAVKDNGADAEMFIDIKLYGFSVPNGLSSKVKPLLKVDARLVKGNRIIWENNVDENDYFWGSEFPEYTLQQLVSDPENIRKSYNKAAEKAAKDLIETI